MLVCESASRDTALPLLAKNPRGANSAKDGCGKGSAIDADRMPAATESTRGAALTPTAITASNSIVICIAYRPRLSPALASAMLPTVVTANHLTAADQKRWAWRTRPRSGDDIRRWRACAGLTSGG